MRDGMLFCRLADTLPAGPGGSLGTSGEGADRWGCAIAAAGTPVCWLAVAWILVSAGRGAEPAPANPTPVPAVQVIPLPYDQASFQHLGRELTRAHFGLELKRPFLYPLVGPSGRSHTRMGHPHDPFGHSHHNSVWIAHTDVDGVSFWEDRTPPRIVCQRVEQYEDGEDEAWMLATHAWMDGLGRTVLAERRRIEVRVMDRGEWLLVIDLQLTAPRDRPVKLGQTPFGMIGVRMAKSIGVHDGGGRILNSQGHRNEAQAFRKPARWVDYSGPITAEASGGVALLDHPVNPGHPTPFHLRDDGWMGASLTLRGPLVIEPRKPLRLRYGLWVHSGVPRPDDVDAVWKAFVAQPLPAMVRGRRR